MSAFNSLLTVSSFTLLSRIAGLVRESLVANAFGASHYTDAFNIAFRIPNLLRRLSAEGAFSQAFIPILSEFKDKHGKNETRSLVDATMTILLWTLVFLSILGIVAANDAVSLIASGLKKEKDTFELAVVMTRIMFPYIALISLTSLAASILNVYCNFWIPAFSPFLLNLSFIISIIFIAPYLEYPILALSWAVIAGGIMQLIVQLYGLGKIGMVPHFKANIKFAFNHPGVKRILLKMMPSTFGVSIAQISLIINTNIASRLTVGSVSWLSYADRLMEFPTSLIGVALGTVLMPYLSKAHSQDDSYKYSSLLDWGLRLTFLIGAPSAITLFLFSEPITAALFNYGRFDSRDVFMVARALTAYSISLIGLISVKILASAFYAKHDVLTPVKCAAITLVITQISNSILVPKMGHAGLALSIGIGACLNGLMLFLILNRKGIYEPSRDWFLFLSRILVACLISGKITSWLTINFDWIALQKNPLERISLLSLCILLGFLIYFLLLYAMGLRYKNFRERLF